MPHDIALKGMNTVHRVLRTLTCGVIGNDVMGMPVLELVTTGRKSGQERAVMLTSPLQEGDTLVVVASRGGDDHHPAWYHNLSAKPEVEVAYKGGPRRPMLASVATPQERARMWPQIASTFRNYAGYQRRTDREIPLVLLRPV